MVWVGRWNRLGGHLGSFSLNEKSPFPAVARGHDMWAVWDLLPCDNTLIPVG